MMMGDVYGYVCTRTTKRIHFFSLACRITILRCEKCERIIVTRKKRRRRMRRRRKISEEVRRAV